MFKFLNKIGTGYMYILLCVIIVVMSSSAPDKPRICIIRVYFRQYGPESLWASIKYASTFCRLRWLIDCRCVWFRAKIICSVLTVNCQTLTVIIFSLLNEMLIGITTKIYRNQKLNQTKSIVYLFLTQLNKLIFFSISDLFALFTNTHTHSLFVTNCYLTNKTWLWEQYDSLRTGLTSLCTAYCPKIHV